MWRDITRKSLLYRRVRWHCRHEYTGKWTRLRAGGRDNRYFWYIGECPDEGETVMSLMFYVGNQGKWVDSKDTEDRRISFVLEARRKE